MSAGRHDIVIEEGATFTLSATWEISGAAVNLSGYTASFKLISSSGDTVATITSPSGITLGGAAGTIVVTITDEATDGYDFNSGRYVLELTSGGGVTTRLLQGGVTFDRR